MTIHVHVPVYGILFDDCYTCSWYSVYLRLKQFKSVFYIMIYNVHVYLIPCVHITVFILLKAFSKYYKGGFETKMSKREAGLILGVR